MADEPTSAIGLHSLKPPRAAARPRKRVGAARARARGKTAGRGRRAPARARAPRSAPRFEGGQNPIHMRMRKLRGPHMKKSMPFEPFRTHTQPVNLARPRGALRRRRRGHARGAAGEGPGHAQGHPGEDPGQGELCKALTVHAHAFSAAARERIEAAGGTCQIIE